MPGPQKTVFIPKPGPFGTDQLQGDQQLNNLHPLRIKFANWTDDGWKDPDDCRPFPLREFAPDVVQFLAENSYFTTRDIKAIIQYLDLDIDFRDLKGFYSALLDIIEPFPWITPIIEIEVARGRSRMKSALRSNHSKMDRVLSKLPLHKLRLSVQDERYRDELHTFLSEDPVAGHLAVAAFCEYAIYHYGERLSTCSNDVLDFLTSLVLGRIDPAGIGGELAEFDDPFEILKAVEIYFQECLFAPGKQHRETIDTMISVLKSICQELSSDGDSRFFDALSTISTMAGAATQKLRQDDRENMLCKLETLGFVSDRKNIGPDLEEIISRNWVIKLVNLTINAQKRLLHIDSRLSEIDAKIAESTRKKHYTALGGLAEEASALKRERNTLATRIENWSDALPSVIAGDIERQGDLPGSIHDAFIESRHVDQHNFEEGDEGTPDVGMEVHGETEDRVDARAPEEIPVDEAAEPVGEYPDATTVAEKPDGKLASGSTDDGEIPELEEKETTAETGTASEGDIPEDNPMAQIEETPQEDVTVASKVLVTSADKRIAPDGSIAAVDAELGSNPKVSAENNLEVDAPLDPVHLPDLISRNLLGLAADAAEAVEAAGATWPIEAEVLRVAAASRTAHRGYGPDAQRFLSIASRATSVDSDAGAAVVLGALLRPAIIEQSFSLRPALSGLARGALGQHLQQIADAVSTLDYDFPPNSDELARISGAHFIPQKKRISDQLSQWCKMTAGKRSRWPFATHFMHQVISEAGLIGKACKAISENRKDATSLAREAMGQLGDQVKIETHSRQFAHDINKPTLRLHPKGVEYLQRQFEEALVMLGDWIKAVEREGSQSQSSEARLRKTVGNLRSRMIKAIKALEAEVTQSTDELTGAIANWLAERIREALTSLDGGDTGDFSTLKEALVAERDLLPAKARANIEHADDRLESLVKVFDDGGIPTPQNAMECARLEGAFETAMQLTMRYDLDGSRTLVEDTGAFARRCRNKIEQLKRRLKMLAKVDYVHQEEIARRLGWCESTLEHLVTIEDESLINNLSEIPVHIIDLNRIAETIEKKIRADQSDRIREYCTEQNAEDVDALLAAAGELTIEAIEDRIALLRDGSPAAILETDLEGLMRNFAQETIEAAAGPYWPKNLPTYQSAFAADGPLFIEEDRRSAASELIGLYREIYENGLSTQPSTNKLKTFFGELGFENIRISRLASVGRARAWRMSFSASIQSDGWFLPPVFGSRANGAYTLLLISPDTLPESIQKVLQPETPTIVLVAGVADPARRHEFAKRMRENAIPALFIDEALIAYTATQRDTRARTIFECGLPYGRVEPYTTDAGQIPTEMFFGREAEIRSIMSKSADGCLVYGGRQLGKSVLLSHIARMHHAPENDRIVQRRDVKSLGNAEPTSAIWSHINSMLASCGVVKVTSRTADEASHDIRNWLSTRPRGQIICMFDETDHFMAADTKADYPELSRLKELMEDTDRAFKVVFAGLHNVQRMHRQPNSPLAHLGQAICIGPLNRTLDDKRAAHDLVVAPMRAAGFRFESMEAIEAILAWANYYPSLVQEYAKGLLATLHGAGSGKQYRLDPSGPLWTILTESLFAHSGFQQIETRVRDKFHLTLDLDPRYALVAYTLAWLNSQGEEHKVLVQGFLPSELWEQAKDFWPKRVEQPSQASFDTLLDELFDLGVLGRVPIPETQRFSYCLRTSQVAAMLGSNDDIERALLELEEKDPTVSYDRTIYRRPYIPDDQQGTVNPMDMPYSPLTDLQIERILSPNDGAVRIICGLSALGLPKIGVSLRRIAETGLLPGATPTTKIEVSSTRNSKELRAQIDRKRPDNTLGVVVHTPVSAREADKELSWLEERPAVLNGKVRPVVLFDAADREEREIAHRRRDQTEYLSAWGEEMIRMHMHYVEVEHSNLDTTSARQRILETTGGIPTDTIALIKALSKSDNLDEVFEDWTPCERLPDEITKGVLGQALQAVDGATRGDDYLALNDIVREITGADLTTLGPDLIATSLVIDWNPKMRRIRRSALGDLVAQRIEALESSRTD